MKYIVLSYLITFAILSIMLLVNYLNYRKATVHAKEKQETMDYKS